MTMAETKTAPEHKIGPKSAEDWPKFRLYGKDIRSDLHTLYEIITELGVWKDFGALPANGYMDAHRYDCAIDQIRTRVTTLQKGYLDPLKWSRSLRCMHYLYVHGWDKFESVVIKEEVFDKAEPAKPVAPPPPILQVQTPSQKVTLWVLPPRVREGMKTSE